MILSHREEVSLLIMLLHDCHELTLSSRFGIEDLALAIDDELLKIVRHLLVDTEVLHVVRYRYSELFTELEKVLHSNARSEDNS